MERKGISILIRKRWGCGVMGCRSPDVTNVTSHSSLALSVLEDTNKNSLLLHWEPFQADNEKFHWICELRDRSELDFQTHKATYSIIPITLDGFQIALKTKFKSVCLSWLKNINSNKHLYRYIKYMFRFLFGCFPSLLFISLFLYYTFTSCDSLHY